MLAESQLVQMKRPIVARATRWSKTQGLTGSAPSQAKQGHWSGVMVEAREQGGDGGLVWKNLALRDMHIEVMAVLVIHIFMAGLQPVT